MGGGRRRSEEAGGGDAAAWAGVADASVVLQHQAARHIAAANSPRYQKMQSHMRVTLVATMLGPSSRAKTASSSSGVGASQDESPPDSGPSGNNALQISRI